MDRPALAVIVLAAGQGTRMKSALPKVMHGIAGRPMLAHVLAVAKALGPQRIVVVTAPGAQAVARLAAEWGAETVVQERQLGTGHAVLAGEKPLAGFDGNLMVLFGDAPLLTQATLSRLTARLGKVRTSPRSASAPPIRPAMAAWSSRAISLSASWKTRMRARTSAASTSASPVCSPGALPRSSIFCTESTTATPKASSI